MKNRPVYISGDYVLYPCENQFNRRVSYWISKKDYTIAFYAFSVETWEKLPETYPETSFGAYISMFEILLKRYQGGETK